MSSSNVYGTLKNVDSVALTRGMVVRVSATNSVLRAQADSLADMQGLAGVVGSGIIGVGAPATNIVSSSVKQLVLLETGLTPLAGQTLYASSSTPGRATNVAPALIPIPIGIIGDASTYSRNSLVTAAVVMPGVTPADFAKLATIPAGVRIFVTLLSDEIDVTTTATVGIDLYPGVTSGKFVPVNARWINTAIGGPGSASAGPNVHAGTDGGRTNAFAAQGIVVQAFSGGVDGIAGATVVSTGAVSFDLSAAHPLLDVGTAATSSGGSITWKGKLGTNGFFKP